MTLLKRVRSALLLFMSLPVADVFFIGTSAYALWLLLLGNEAAAWDLFSDEVDYWLCFYRRHINCVLGRDNP